MGVASLVLGIISVIVSFIPLCGVWAIIPAIIGIILGIVEWVKKSKENEPKGKAIAGTICSAIAIVIICIWFVLVGAAANKISDELQSTDWNVVSNKLESTDWNEVVKDWNISIESEN